MVKYNIEKQLFAKHFDRGLNALIDFGTVFLIGFLYDVGCFLFITTSIKAEETLGSIYTISNMFDTSQSLNNINYLVVYLFYCFISESLFQKTVGKWCTGTLVVDLNGNKPNFMNLMKRTLVRAIPFEVLSFLTANARGWHDTLSETYVVYKEKLEAGKANFKAINSIGAENQL